MRSIKLFVAFSVFVFLFSSCTDGFLGSDTKGSITGFVTLYDSEGNKLTDFSGVTVSLENQSIVSTTDQYGKFVLTGVKKGIYNIYFDKTGYGTRKLISYQFLGSGDAFLGSTYISKIPLYSVSAVTSTTSTTAGTVTLNFSFTGTTPTGTKNIKYFILDNSLVSNDPQKYQYVGNTNLSSTAVSLVISKATFTLAGYTTSGQTVYMVLYSDSYNYNVSYVDVNTGKYFYTSVGIPSNVVSVTVP